ncbi:MAG TPA: GntR family transcriptional regulator [Streptosporangiaceae bacterium]|jgi:GntR family transcriptional regulator
MTIDKGTDDRGGQRSGPEAGREDAGSPIEFLLDPGSGVPTYLQLVHQVEHALRLGYLKPGDQLPTVKGTVTELAINPNTVLKAYRELENRGLAVGRPGQGTFVEGTLAQAALPELSALRATLLGWLGTARNAGLDEDGMAALFASALREFRGRPAESARRSAGRRGSGESYAEGVA